MRRAMRAGAMLFAVLLVSCDGPGVVRPGGPMVGVSGPATLADAIVGSWQRVLYFIDDLGFVRSSETLWQFASDGTAVRAVYSRNLTTAVADVLLSTARWQVEGAAIRIAFLTPSPGTVLFDARVQGDTLYLAGQPFARQSR